MEHKDVTVINTWVIECVKRMKDRFVGCMALD